MTIKPINRTMGVLLSADSPYGVTSSVKRIIQNSQVIKKKIKLEKSREPFWLITQAQNFPRHAVFTK